MTKSEFVVKAQDVYGDFYNYTKTIVTNCRDIVTITCPVHGDFKAVAGEHYRAIKGRECPLCIKERKIQRQLVESKKLFIQKAKEVHGNKYQYDLTGFTLISKSTIPITCAEHGVFTQSCAVHLRGSGCPTCGIKQNSISRSSNTQDYVSKAAVIHNGKYCYSKTEYVTCRDKVVIICPIHGEFEQRASAHLDGQGCPECKATGFDGTKPAILYYLSINSGEVYKIGITNRTVEERYSKVDLLKIEILQTWAYTNGVDAAEEEAHMLEIFKQYKYEGAPLLESGNTELFTKDVLEWRTKDTPDDWRADRRYRVWRASVIRRDKKCVICGGMGRQAHHIKNGQHHPDSRFDVDNGVTLCRACHTQFHCNFKNSFREKATEKDWFNFLALVNYVKGLKC